MGTIEAQHAAETLLRAVRPTSRMEPFLLATACGLQLVPIKAGPAGLVRKQIRYNVKLSVRAQQVGVMECIARWTLNQNGITTSAANMLAFVAAINL